PKLPLSSNGRLSVHPCPRGACKGIHALESVAMFQLSQPKQMRRSGYLRQSLVHRIYGFVFYFENEIHDAVSPSFKRLREEEIYEKVLSFVAAGIVKGQARIIAPVWPLTIKISMKPCHQVTQKSRIQPK
ncbi:MAG: hypothetical protein R3309_03220, partial [Reinekea sp.]|nr:hypothetical protein [Reinekea sp.]